MTPERSKFKSQALKTNKEMARLLKLERNEERYTMRALSERLGTPHSFIGKTEQQNRRLDVGEFILYCKALETDPNKIFKQLISKLKDFKAQNS